MLQHSVNMKDDDIKVARKTALVVPPSRSSAQARRSTRNSVSPSSAGKDDDPCPSQQTTSGHSSRSLQDGQEETQRMDKRPRRQIAPIMPRFNAGVSWDEENDLKRALLASLQETQAVKSKSTSPPLRKPMNRAVSRLIKRSTGAKSSKPAVRTPAQAKLRSRIQNRAPTQPASQVKRSLKSPAKSPSRVASRNGTSNNRPLKPSAVSRSHTSNSVHRTTSTKPNSSARPSGSIRPSERARPNGSTRPTGTSRRRGALQSTGSSQPSLKRRAYPPPRPVVADDSSQDSSATSNNSSQPNAHTLSAVCAQRKFAQGSRPCSPSVTPIKSKPASFGKYFTTSRAKTEDFLTFLCLRGTPALPSHLDFYNIEDSDSHSSMPGTPQRSGRPSTPHRGPLFIESSSNSKDPTPDRDVWVGDLDFGVKPLACYDATPTTSPRKSAPIRPARRPISRKPVPRRKDVPAQANKRMRMLQSRRSATVNSRYRPDNLRGALTRAQSATCNKPVVDVSINTPVLMRKKRNMDRGRQLVSKAKTLAARAKKRRTERDISVSPEVMPTQKCRSTMTSSRAAGRAPAVEALVIEDVAVGEATSSETGSDNKTWTQVISDSDDDEISLRRNAAGAQHPNNHSSDTETTQPETDSLKETDSEKRKRKKHRSKSRKEKRRSKSRSREGKEGKKHKDKDRSKKRDRSKSKSKHKRDKKHHRRDKKKRRESSTSSSSVSSSVRESEGYSDRDGTESWSTDTQTKLETVVEVLEEATCTTRRLSGHSRQSSPARSPARSPAAASPRIPAYRGGFPSPTDPGQLIDVPTYHPSMEQFQDPISYIQSIRPDAEPYGMCTIVPPDGWKPECQIRDDMRFSCHIQYIHRMQNRWGPNTLKFECIKRHLESQDIKLEQPPMMSGAELDLPSLHEIMKHHGGMENVMEKNKWAKVMEALKLPKVAHNSTSRLYECYCKFLVSYDTLSKEEKQKLEQQVTAERMRKRSPYMPDCVVKCKSRPLDEFFKYAKFSEAVWFDEDPTYEQVEEKYWKLLLERRKHISIHVGQLDTAVSGSGFPVKRDSPYAKHGWNLNIMQHNPGSLLTQVGPVSGITAPMLHANMLFTTSCWQRDLHLLPYVTYHHTGAPKVWYCVPVSEEEKFHRLVKELNPAQVNNKPVWLLPDEVMISPHVLKSRGISVGRSVQQPGQFVVVFSQSFTSSISCGYNITESLRFAPPDWIDIGCLASKALYASGLAELFSIELLVFTLIQQDSTSLEMMKLLQPHLQAIVQFEMDLRSQLYEIGLRTWERLDQQVIHGTPKRQKHLDPNNITRCEISNKISYLSMVVNEADNTIWCLQNASSQLRRKPKMIKQCKLLYRWDEKELNAILDSTRSTIQNRDLSPSRRKAVVRQL